MQIYISRYSILIVVSFQTERTDFKPDHAVDGTLNLVDADQILDPGANNPMKEIFVHLVSTSS